MGACPVPKNRMAGRLKSLGSNRRRPSTELRQIRCHGHGSYDILGDSIVNCVKLPGKTMFKMFPKGFIVRLRICSIMRLTLTSKENIPFSQ